MRFLVHLHIFYKNQTDFFIEKLSNISDCDWDLIVTTVDDDEEVRKKITEFKRDAKFLTVKNIGYDIMPFITAMRSINLNDYDYVLKLHTKNSNPEIWYPVNYPYFGKHCTGFWWRDCLVNSLIGSKKIFSLNLKELEKNPNIGMIADKGYLTGTEENSTVQDEDNLNRLKKRLNIDSKLNYFLSGTMFIIKVESLKKLINSDISEEDFSVDAKSHTSSDIAHAIERIFVMLVDDKNLKIKGVSYNMPELKFFFLGMLKKIFSIKNYVNGKYKIITVFGLNIKFRKK